MAKYKLIIIDDEFLVVEGLKETVDWAALDVEVAATCCDGKKGLEAVHRYKPDLVISDIRMPVCDGLQLAELLSRENFDCAFIIYSGYSDFDYVSSAMERGVMRYLLKPIENEKLMEKVREVLTLLEQKRESRKAVEQYKLGLPLIKENLLEQLLSGESAGEAETGLKRIGIELPGSGVVTDCAAASGFDAALHESLYAAASASLKTFETVGLKRDKRFTLITSLEEPAMIADSLRNILGRMTDGTAIRYSAGVSEVYGHGRTLQQAYAQAETLRTGALFPGVNSVNVGTDTTGGGYYKSRLIEEAVKLITQLYSGRLTVKEAADRLYVSESHLMHEFKDNVGKTFNECLTEYRMLRARQLLDGGGALRIKEVAAKVGYGDVKYFSQVFKDYTGITPAEYAEKALARS